MRFLLHLWRRSRRIAADEGVVAGLRYLARPAKRWRNWRYTSKDEVSALTPRRRFARHARRAESVPTRSGERR